MSMNRKEAAELLPIIKAYAEGKEIEIFDETKRMWITAILPHFNCDSSSYRIKPESKYRPFKDAEECWTEMLKHQPFGWVKGDECFYNIVSVSNIDVSMANVSGDIVILNFSDVMEDNTFADGFPFGVKVEE